MSPIERTVFVVLWLAVLLLAALLVMIYRQVDRAYRRSALDRMRGLPAGTPVPTVEVLADGQQTALRLDPDEAVQALVFVSTDCKVCSTLRADLNRVWPLEDRLTVLVTGEFHKPEEAEWPGRVLWVTHSFDVAREFGVVVVPFAYAIASGAIVASRAIGGSSELRALFDEAHQILASKEAAEPAIEPVTEGVR